jgi:hypothetical protein
MGQMFGITTGTILDVAIGLAVMYLMFSLVATTLNEMVATMIKLRARYLSSAIPAIIDHAPLRADFYKSGVIRGIDTALQAVAASSPMKLGFSKSQTATSSQDSDTVTISQGSATRHPSYISSDNFAHALLNSLDPSKSLPVFSDVRQSVQLMPNCNIRDVLLAQIVAANGDLDKLRTGVATWFDDAMDRVGGVYKRDMKYISVIVGILLAIAFNADSVSVTRALWEDPTLRAAMVQVAQKELAKSAPQLAPNTPPQPAQAAPDAPPPTAKELNKEMTELQQKVTLANAALKPLPIGWSLGALTLDPVTWIGRIIGWLITGLAVSLGAPFWFDLLNKFMNIRGTGDKPAKANDT